jgi:hypothetical protein
MKLFELPHFAVGAPTQITVPGVSHVKMCNFVEVTQHVEASGELIGERLVVDKIVGARGTDRSPVKTHRINIVAL